MTARRSGLPRPSPSLGPRRQRHPRKCSITRLGPPGLRMCHRVAQEPAAAVPQRQVPVIRSNSEAHAWLKLKKRGRKLALRVLTFPTFRQHVSPREIQRFVVRRIERSAPSATNSGISRNLKSETGGYKFQKSLKPEQTDEQTIHRRIFPLRRSGHRTGKICEFRYGPLPSGRSRASAPRRSPPATRTGPAAGPWRSPTGPDKRPSGTPAPSAGCCF